MEKDEKKFKIVAVAGSTRPKSMSNTYKVLKIVADEINKDPLFKAEIYNLNDLDIKSCIGCDRCKYDNTCSIQDDYVKIFHPLFLNNPKVKGLIVATPVYYAGMSAKVKAFFERTLFFRRKNFAMRDIIGGAIAVSKSRNGGVELALIDIITSFLVNDMVVVPDSAPTSHFGGAVWSGHADGVEKDVIGIASAINLGKRMMEVIKKMYLK